MTRPTIGFLTAGDARDRSTWSGIPFYMAQALQRHCGDVAYLGPVFAYRHLLGRVRSGLSRKLRGRRIPYEHTLPLSAEYARRIGKTLPPRIDVIFAASASTEIASLDTDIPIVYSTDATLRLLHGYYPGFSGLTDAYIRDAEEIERRALHRSSLVLYPSEWAARSARDHYGVTSSRVHVVPYGANLDVVPSARAIAAAKGGDRCDLLFLGVDWARKGGAIAYDATRLLRERGIDARLTICGTTPDFKVDAAFTTVIPRLDKNIPAEQARLSALLLEATLLILPTWSECYGIVFCEASAHGTPSVTRDTGGVGGAVTPGENGVLLPPEAGAAEYADVIACLVGDRARYAAMVASSRAAFDARLNWDEWGTRVAGLIRTL